MLKSWKSIFALACLATLVTACGKPTTDTIESENYAAIYGGNDVTVASNRWRNSVAIKGDSTICSGVLVSKNVILTAGHCMWAFERSKGLKLLFFKGADVASEVRLEKSDFDLVTHPDFNENGGAATESFHDMGLVVLSGNVIPTTHSPPKVFTGKLTVGDSLLTVGNGLTERGSVYSTRKGMLREVASKLQVVESNNGGKTARAYSLTTTGNGTCGGDSGGAVYIKKSTGYELIGVHVSADDKLSSEIGCGTETGITVLTPSMRAWIKSHL